MNIRLAAKWKIDCIQDPIATARIHGRNESLINKHKEIDELKIWCEEMKTNPVFSSKTGFDQILLKTSYLELLEAILTTGFKKNFLKAMKYPFCFNKIKLIIALFLPKFVIKKIKDY